MIVQYMIETKTYRFTVWLDVTLLLSGRKVIEACCLVYVSRVMALAQSGRCLAFTVRGQIHQYLASAPPRLFSR